MSIDELIPKNTVTVKDSNDQSGNYSMNRRGFLGYMSRTMITAGISLMLLLYGAGCQESQRQAQLNQPVQPIQPETSVTDRSQSTQKPQRTFQKGDYGIAETADLYANAGNAAELAGRVATDVGRASYKVPFLRVILPDKPAN